MKERARVPEHDYGPVEESTPAIDPGKRQRVLPLQTPAANSNALQAPPDAPTVSEPPDTTTSGETGYMPDGLGDTGSVASYLLRVRPEPRTVRLATSLGVESQPVTVALRNDGTAPFRLVDLVLDQGDASSWHVYGAGGGDVGVGESAEIRVAFRPERYQRSNDWLRVIGEQGTTAASVRLCGTVVSETQAQTARGEALASDATAWKRPGTPQTYAAMLDLMHAAAALLEDAARSEDGTAFHRTHASELAELVVARLAELDDGMGAIKQGLNGITQMHVSWRFDQSRLAALELHNKAALGGSVNTAYALHQFTIGREEILVLTGEQKESTAIQQLDDAGDTALRGHLIAYGAGVAAPLAAAGAIEAAPFVATEAGILWFASKNAVAGVTTWALGNPVVATELAGIATGLGLEIGEHGIEGRLAQTESREGIAMLIMELAIHYLSLHSAHVDGGGGSRRVNDVELPPGVPPQVARSAVGPAPSSPERVVRATAEATDRVRAFIDAIKTKRVGVEVPRDRARTAAPDGQDVVVESGTFGEHYQQARYQRQMSRADDGDGLYETNRRHEGAAVIGRLVASGGVVRGRFADPFTGDVLVDVELPNGRRVQIHEERAGAPRMTLPRDRREAQLLRQQAAQARQAMAEADKRVMAQVLALANERGEIDHVFERGILGGGGAAVLDYATLPPRGPVEVSDALPRVITVSAAPEPWGTREGDMGQPPHEFARPGVWDDMHQDLLTEPTTYTPSAVHGDVLDLTRAKNGQRTMYGWTVREVTEVKDETWLRQDANVRATLVGKDGRPLVMYYRNADITMGPGAGRRLAPSQLSDDAARVRLEGDGRLTYGDEQLSNPRGGHVLVSGGSATGAWNADLVRKKGGTVTWVARTDMGPVQRNNALRAEHATNTAELGTIKVRLTAPELPDDERAALNARRAYLEQRQDDLERFAAAMFVRNSPTFEDPGVKRVATEIKRVTPSEEMAVGEHAGKPGKVHVEFTDGSEGWFDQVVVSHGPDPMQAGGVEAVTRPLGTMRLIESDGEVAGLQSQSGHTRVLGAGGWQGAWTSRLSRADEATFLDSRSRQASALPTYSNGVADAVAMAGRTIPAANKKLGEEP